VVRKTFKPCCTCKVNLPLEDFYNDKSSKDGKTVKCKVCTKLYSNQYKAKHKEDISAYSKEYNRKHYQENREARLEWQKEYRLENLDERREYDRKQSKVYYSNNKDAAMEKSARRRAIKAQAMPPWVDETHLKRLRSIYKTCKNVSERTGKVHHVDHIVPLKGDNICGLHVWWNLRIIPARMNLSKGNKLEVF
jgi:hypothetical protein